MENRKLMALTMGFTSELAVLIIVSNWLANTVAESTNLDNNLTTAGFIGGAFIIWLIHVSVLFSKLTKNDS